MISSKYLVGSGGDGVSDIVPNLAMSFSCDFIQTESSLVLDLGFQTLSVWTELDCLVLGVSQGSPGQDQG